MREPSSGFNGFVQGHTGTLSGLHGVVISLSSTCSPHAAARMILCQRCCITSLPCLETFCGPLLFLVSELWGESSWQEPSAPSGARRPQWQMNGQLQQPLQKSRDREAENGGSAPNCIPMTDGLHLGKAHPIIQTLIFSSAKWASEIRCQRSPQMWRVLDTEFPSKLQSSELTWAHVFSSEYLLVSLPSCTEWKGGIFPVGTL